MKRTKIVLLLITPLLLSGATHDEIVRRDLLLSFERDTSLDWVVNGHTPLDGMTFENRYGGILRTSGWPRERFFQEVDSIVSNGCSQLYTEVVMDDLTRERISSKSMDYAVNCLCHADSNEWIRCAGWLLTNGIDQCARSIGKLYVRRHGLTDEAFDLYCRIVASENGISPKMRHALVGEVARASEKSPSPCASNGVVRLILSEGLVDPRTFSGMDEYLCAYWQGYAVSSNRYVNFQRARSQINADFWQTGCDAVLRELEQHQPLPLLPTNTVNGVAW